MKAEEVGALALAAALLGVAWWVKKKGGVAPAAAAAAGALASAAGQAATGAVVGIGQAVGVPPTDDAQCNAAISAGDTFGASKYCPAGTFLANLWGTATSSAQDPNQSAEETARLARYQLAGNTDNSGAVSASYDPQQDPAFYAFP